MRRVMLLGAALTLLCGCSPNAREPDNLALVRVLGVDGASSVILTAVCSGTDGARGSCGGESFEQARERLPWSGTAELTLSSVSYLVVSAGVPLASVLLDVLEDHEMGASATVWLAGQSAEAVLEGCEDPVGGMELLTQQGVSAPTVAQALGALMTEGRVLLPVVTQQRGCIMFGGEAQWSE